MLLVLCRSVGGDKSSGRPLFHSKIRCLHSLNRALQLSGITYEVEYLNDTVIPGDRLSVMEKTGRVTSLGGLGNSGSYRYALSRAVQSTSDWVYFAEDDYLYCDDAFGVMWESLKAIPKCDYITLYDHPDRYTRSDDAAGGRSHLAWAAGRHWRTVESTCMTFAARRNALARDAWAHRLGTFPRTPRDREIWRLTLGLGKYCWKFPKRRLWSPMPSLATHMAASCMAYGVDWESVANAADRGAGS